MCTGKQRICNSMGSSDDMIDISHLQLHDQEASADDCDVELTAGNKTFPADSFILKRASKVLADCIKACKADTEQLQSTKRAVHQATGRMSIPIDSSAEAVGGMLKLMYGFTTPPQVGDTYALGVAAFKEMIALLHKLDSPRLLEPVDHFLAIKACKEQAPLWRRPEEAIQWTIFAAQAGLPHLNFECDKFLARNAAAVCTEVTVVDLPPQSLVQHGTKARCTLHVKGLACAHGLSGSMLP